MGTDALVRPDDEDSPEFQEYLKQLLQLSVARAKNGFASPSSGSADAYIAKLNRLKIERNARIRAGLPDEELDKSYKPEDYRAAITEMQEPMVRNTPIPSGDGRKSRVISREELEIAERAEAAARRALELKKEQDAGGKAQEIVAKPVPSQLELPAPKNLPSKPDSPVVVPPMAVIPRTTPPPPSPPRPPQTSSTAATVSKQVTSSRPIQESPAKPPSPPPVPAQSLPPRATTVSTSQTGNPTSTQRSPRADTKSKQQTSPAKPSFTRKLESSELETLAEALQLLVKHRGGGPFGLGRLQGEEASRLVESLQAAVVLLREDTNAAVAAADGISPLIPTSTSLKVTTAPPAEIRLPPVQRTESPVVAGTAIPAAQVVPAAASSAAVGPSATATTNRIGTLAAILSESSISSMSLQELDLVRATLARALGTVQTVIDSRAMSAPHSSTAGSTPVRTPSPLVSQPPTYAQPVLSPVSDQATALSPAAGGELDVDGLTDSELKTTLGLLLKHRGGPGFGHGRLQGPELSRMQKMLRSVADKLMSEAERYASS